MVRRILYPGTFDPVTHGHLDLIRRAARLFDRVIIAVAENPTKKALFDLSERVALLKECTREFSNVDVIGFSGLLVDLAHQQQTNILLRGVRGVNDFDYEQQLANVNRRLSPQLETLLLTPTEQWACISSTIVREVSLHGGDVSTFVPAPVLMALQQKHPHPST